MFVAVTAASADNAQRLFDQRSGCIGRQVLIVIDE